MKKCDWGWQGEAKKLRLRAEFLLTNLASLPIPADITFQFDKDGSVETLSAHKIFLAIGSEVFMAMFYGPAADPTQTTLHIPNYSKTVFQALVYFLYSDRIADSFVALDDGGLWMELLESAMQYGLPELTTKCREHIVRRLICEDKADVCTILFEARRLDEGDIEREALKALDSRPIEILSRLPDISTDLLTEIVQRSQLNIKNDQELELYNVVRRWAMVNDVGEWQLPDFYAEAYDADDCMVKTNPLRQQLGPIFQHIRFPLMSPSQLLDGPIKLYHEVHDTLRRLSKVEKSASVSPPKKYRDDWSYFMHLDVVPDWQACPETSRRFINLCRDGYRFALASPQNDTAVPHSSQPEFVVDPSQELYLPLPTWENSLMHDSAGTVSLCVVNNNKGDGSHYKLFFSPNNELKLGDTGVVFGRLANWSGSLQALETVGRTTELIHGFLKTGFLKTSSSVG